MTAIIFMLYDRLCNPILWSEFFQPDNGFSLYAHFSEEKHDESCFPERTKCFCNLVPSEYAVILSLIRHLLREALKDKENTKFMFASGTCIPLKPAPYVRSIMEESDNSYIDMHEMKHIWTPRLVEELRPWFMIHPVWVTLNRKHAEMYAYEDEVFPKFRGTRYTEENYLGTMLKKEGMDKDADINIRCLTGADWKHPERDGCSPKTFSRIDDVTAVNHLLELARGGCLFARKYLTLSDSDVSIVRDLIWTTKQGERPC